MAKIRVLFGATCLISVLVASFETNAQGAGKGVLLRDGVVVDLEKRTVFAMKEGNRIDALALGSGDLLWSSPEAARPLGLAGGVLLAQREGVPAALDLEVAFLDALTGAPRSRAALPATAAFRSAVDEGLGSKLEIVANPAGSGWSIAWRATVQTIRGALLADEGDGSEDLRVVTSAAALELSGAARALVAPTTFAPQPLIRLVPETQRIAGFSGEQYLSVDDRHVIVSERLADDRVWNRWRWRVFDATTKAALGTVDHPVSIAPFLVVDQTLLFESRPSQHLEPNGELVDEKLSIRAQALGSGRELWALEIRDTTYYGPFPP